MLLPAIFTTNAEILERKSNILPLNPVNGDTWSKTYTQPGWETYITCIDQTTDGGYILLGHLRNEANDHKIWLIKINGNGDTLWEKFFNGIAGEIQQTNDGGYVLVGTTKLFGDGLHENIWLIKTDENGNEEWNKTFGGNYDAHGISGQQTKDGGYIFTGYKEYSGNKRDGWIIKTDDIGEIEWEKTIDKDGYDAIDFIQQTADGGYIFIGVTGAEYPSELFLWLQKIDPNGDEIWSKTWLYPDCNTTLHAHVQQTSDGGYIVVAWIMFIQEDPPAVDTQIWLIKTDANGEMIWDKMYGKTTDSLWSTDSASMVQQTNDGGYIITGGLQKTLFNYADLLILKTNANGEKEWEKTYGKPWFHTEIGQCIEQTSDGGFIIGAVKSDNSDEPDSRKGWVIKTDEKGNFQRSRSRSINPLLSTLLARFPVISKFLQLINNF